MRRTFWIAQNREAVTSCTPWRVLLTWECWLQLEWPNIRSLPIFVGGTQCDCTCTVLFHKLRKPSCPKPMVVPSLDSPTHVFRSSTGHEQPYRGDALASPHSLNIDLDSDGPAHTCRGYDGASCVFHAELRCAWPPWQSHGARVSILHRPWRRKALLWAMW